MIFHSKNYEICVNKERVLKGKWVIYPAANSEANNMEINKGILLRPCIISVVVILIYDILRCYFFASYCVVKGEKDAVIKTRTISLVVTTKIKVLTILGILEKVSVWPPVHVCVLSNIHFKYFICKTIRYNIPVLRWPQKNN